MSAQQQKIRRVVWTAAIASVTATGAWYGAGLKTKSELKQVCLSFLSRVAIFHPPLSLSPCCTVAELSLIHLSSWQRSVAKQRPRRRSPSWRNNEVD
jgi:hypothetical protein